MTPRGTIKFLLVAALLLGATFSAAAAPSWYETAGALAEAMERAAK